MTPCAKPLMLGNLVAIAILLSGCGGRVSRPVAATTPYDAQLDCAHLRAEKSVNAAKARDLAGEQNIDSANAVGTLLFTPIILLPMSLNLGQAEQTELKAFAAREEVLNKLIAEKCPTPNG